MPRAYTFGKAHLWMDEMDRKYLRNKDKQKLPAAVCVAVLFGMMAGTIAFCQKNALEESTVYANETVGANAVCGSSEIVTGTVSETATDTVSEMTTGIICETAGVGCKDGGEAVRTEQEKELDAALHAKAAVLFDMDGGRVLYEKNGSEVLPMASTTKIMTCILALEEGDIEDIVTASAYAAGQPKVHLGMQKGMNYRLGDLLYSLMLESHNDSAVAIAEHIGSKHLSLPKETERTKGESREAVAKFCELMTEKAEKLGCMDTCFLTPNGLDAEFTDTRGEKCIHSTTAADLARIMSYCVTQSEKKDEFLEITQTPAYAFSDQEKKTSYSCINHNALLTMLDGALSGKTGFTSQAGYCYVGAMERDGKQLALALLACGWPGHKSWKWEDCRRLFSYGLEQYSYRELAPEIKLSEIEIRNGEAKDGDPWKNVSVKVKKEDGDIRLHLLTREGEEVRAYVDMKKQMDAPVAAGTEVGSVRYCLETDGRSMEIGRESIYVGEDVEKKNYTFIFRYIWRNFLI